MNSSTDDREEERLFNAFLRSPDQRLIAPADTGEPCINICPDGNSRECRIWEGYFDASCMLFEKMFREKHGRHGLVFPALYNLRHGMEVALKWHIRNAGGQVPKGAGHNLEKLVDTFRAAISDVDDGTKETCEYVFDRVAELAEIDPKSVTFRYSTEIDGTDIEVDSNSWCLRRLYFSAEHISLIFDNLSDWIDLSRNEEYQNFLKSNPPDEAKSSVSHNV